MMCSKTLWVTILLFGLSFGRQLHAADATHPRQPNILVIMSDEHNASVLRCYGNSIVRTPNLDRLATQGILFEQAHTNSPLCDAVDGADKEHPAQRELYDLGADPGEFTNLAGLPQHQETIQRLHAALAKELGEDPEDIERRCRSALASGYDDGGKTKQRKAKQANRP